MTKKIRKKEKKRANVPYKNVIVTRAKIAARLIYHQQGYFLFHLLTIKETSTRNNKWCYSCSSK